jgi:aminoglycoside phosphotransferase (APT) family kinase protein
MASARVPAPPPATLAWLAAEVGAGAKVVRCRRLLGGSASVVHAVCVEHRSGNRQWIALKRYPREWASAAGTDAGATQIQVELERLEVVRRVALPVPVVIAADVNGTATSGEPAIATTLLAGRVDFTLSDSDSWIRGAAAMLASVHDLAVDAPVHRTWPDKSKLEVPAWTARPDVWEQAISLIDPQPPAVDLSFTHGDYHTGNLLWRGGRLSGVLDWLGSGRWYPDADLAGLAVARRCLTQAR